MSSTNENSPTFKELEREGWERNASSYDDYAGQVTKPAVEAMLQSVSIDSSDRLLDVACGPGYAAGEATKYGAIATGIDISPSMLMHAKSIYPDTNFMLGDAESLEFETDSFDIALCAFGLLHLAEPEKAMSEVRRVLTKEGSFVSTVWCGPDRHDFFALVLSAIQKHGNMDVGLPPAPPTFRFSDHDEFKSTLSGAGFGTIQIKELPLLYRTNSAQDLIDLLYRSTVRTALILERQAPGVAETIHTEIVNGAQRFKANDEFELKWPAVMAIAKCD